MMPGKPGGWLLLATCALVLTVGCGCGGATQVTAQGVVRFSEELRDGVVSESLIAYPSHGTTVCAGTGRDSDLTSGESIIIRDSSDKIVGTGQLESGKATFKDASTGKTVRGAPRDRTGVSGTVTCTMPFQVDDVDHGSSFYVVAIGDRVPLFRVERSQLESMVLEPHG